MTTIDASRVLVVCGTGRSGSSIVAALLAAHPQCVLAIGSPEWMHCENSLLLGQAKLGAIERLLAANPKKFVVLKRPEVEKNESAVEGLVGAKWIITRRSKLDTLESWQRMGNGLDPRIAEDPEGVFESCLSAQRMLLARPDIEAKVFSPDQLHKKPDDFLRELGKFSKVHPYRFDNEVRKEKWNGLERRDWLRETAIDERPNAIRVEFRAGGFGDNFLGAQLVESMPPKARDRVIFHNRSGNGFELFSDVRVERFLGHPHALSLGSWFDINGADRDPKNSLLEHWRTKLPKDVRPRRFRRPKPRFEEADFHLSESVRDSVIFFPSAAFDNRAWSVSHWSILSRLIRRRLGLEVHALVPKGESSKAQFADLYFDGLGWCQIARAMRLAKLSVSADSAPAHFAGILGSPHVSIHALNRPQTLYKHAQSVSSVFGRLGCSGCERSEEKGFLAFACNSRCASLDTIDPERVFDHVATRLKDL